MKRTTYKTGFTRLWAATGVSLVGSQVSLVAVPLTAVLTLHASAGEVAALTAAGTAPFLLFGLPAGVWLERWSLRRLMVLADLVRALVLASVPLAFACGVLGMPLLFLVAFAVGAGGVFFDVAALSVLPSLVPGGRLAAANSRIEVARAAAQTSGPALGGWLVHLVTAPVAVVVDAVSYLASAWLLRGLPDTRLVAPARQRRRLVPEVLAGLRYCLTHPYIRALVLGASWINLWVEALMAVVVTYAVRTLHLSAAEIGLVLGVSNVGYLLGSVAVPRLAARIGVGRSIAVGVVLHGGLALVALARTGAPVLWLVAGFTLFTAGGALWNVNAVSLRQAVTEPAMLARMNASNRFLIWGTMPLGAAAGGVLASVAGLATAVTVAGCAIPLVVVPLLFSAVARVREMPDHTLPVEPGLGAR
ncbi:MAG: MFS transporter [Nocardioidaceae bacterium]